MITKEKIDEANEMIRKIDFKGKGYALVASRISAFRAICPRGRITTEIVSMENGVVTMKSTVIDEDDRELSNGYAQEKEGATYINKTSYIENCETSAIGRALGNLGIGSDENIASAEELANAVLNQGNEPKKAQQKNQAKPKEEKPEEKPPISDEEANAQMVASVDPRLIPSRERTKEEMIANIEAEMKRTGINKPSTLATMKIKSWDELTDAKYVAIMNKFVKQPTKGEK